MTEYGYLKYVPSFKKNRASKIFFTIDYDEKSNAEYSRGDTVAADFPLQKGEIAQKDHKEKEYCGR